MLQPLQRRHYACHLATESKRTALTSDARTGGRAGADDHPRLQGRRGGQQDPRHRRAREDNKRGRIARAAPARERHGGAAALVTTLCARADALRSRA
jgi:hypothetical protein